jgi:hypothetical protein
MQTKEEYDLALEEAYAKAKRFEAEQRKIDALHRAAPAMLAYLESQVDFVRL